MPCKAWLMMGAAGLALVAPLAARAEGKQAARLQRLKSMSALEKDRLKANQERFASLPVEQQEQIRQLEERLESDPRGTELRDVMLRYYEWMRSLSSAERAALNSLPEAERIAKIRTMLQEQESERLRELAKESLTPEDVEQVKAWLLDLFQRRKPELLRELPPHVREKLTESNDPRHLMHFVNHLRDRDRTKPPPLLDELQAGPEDRERLLGKLSNQAREVYRQAGGDEEKQRMIFQHWFFIAFRPRPPSPEDLQEFFTRLPPEERDRLENLPPDQMRAEVARKYFFDRARRWEKEFRPRK